MGRRLALPFFEGFTSTLHIAHRGGARCFPENTWRAFREAVALGTDMIETDVHLSADGVVMIHHDDLLDRCTDAEGPLAARTAAELAMVDPGDGAGVPRLDAVLAGFPDLRFNIDLKAERLDLVDAFVATVEAAGAVDRICMGSEHTTVAERLFEALPDAAHFFPRAALIQWVMAALTRAPLPGDDRWAMAALPLEFNGARIVTPELVAAAVADDRFLAVWTVDEVAEMRALRDMGVGGVMTDRPDRLRAVLDEVYSG